MDKEYTDVSVAEDTNCGYKELVESVSILKAVCENQTETIKILRDEIIQLIRESETHKAFIKTLFSQVATVVMLALPNVDVKIWSNMVKKTMDMGMFDNLYEKVERETK